ncbi:hypothetical protein AB834_04455 [PVC group bacterium (ex Bugula neritina AB1)]|nr:hypothetical protein AB834_04455 [PVC group bacterium (ex Bugula neritina AB1)]
MKSIFRFCTIAVFAFFLNISVLKGKEVDVSSKRATEYRLEGYRCQKKGDLDKAITFYRKALDEDKTYATAHNDLGVVYEKKGMYESAERSYLRAIKQNGEYKAAYTNLAALYENKGDIKKAIYYWKRRALLEKNSPGSSKWMKKARDKIIQLEQRRQTRKEMKDEHRLKQKASRYENKKIEEKKHWSPDTSPSTIEKEIGQRYFDKGISLYNQHKYDEAMASFRMARHHNVHNKDVSRYLVKIHKVKEALAKSDITGEIPYASVVPKEDLLLAKDHFKMGLDYFAENDYERAFSSFTMAMTYNPHDEIIQRYVEDSKIRIQEEKIRRKKHREQTIRSEHARMIEPRDIRSDMVQIKEDMIKKGFVTTAKDMSVEAFINDGHELFLAGRYEDAIYLWKQAILLDVSNIYTEKVRGLIDKAYIEGSKLQEGRLDRLAKVNAQKLMTDVTRAAIPSAKEGSPGWSLLSNRKIGRPVLEEEMSIEKRSIMKKLKVKYTLNFKDASLKGVVDLLAELTGLNIVIDTKEIGKDDLDRGNITFKVSDMPLIKIIEAILRFTNFDYLIEDNLIWITTKEKIRKEDIVLMVYDVEDLIGKIFDFPSEELGGASSKKDGASALKI